MKCVRTIIKIQEKHQNPTSIEFGWDIFLLAGDRPEARLGNGSIIPDNLVGTIKGDIFSSPDGLWFDNDGRLWIQTDYGDDEPRNANGL